MATVTIPKVLEKVREIERGLQALKLELLRGLPPKKEAAFYRDEDILKEVKRVRKALWNEKYSKAA